MDGFRKHAYDDGVFDIHPDNGFLPKVDPLKRLPTEFDCLQKLLDVMPVVIQSGPGLLSIPGAFPEAVENLPNLIDEVKKVDDMLVIQALYRGYAFIESAYLLEPSYQSFVKTGEYGKANRVLPKNISEPLFFVADKLQVSPWLDYHYSYCLGNYYKVDKKGSGNWDNLKMAVQFAGTDDERGFVMVHVDINGNGCYLLQSIDETLAGLKYGDSKRVVKGLKLNYETMTHINKRRREMWKASAHTNYNDFRVFIMGSEGNTEIFGDGVIYEGVSDKPLAYRGQTGAQDDIIPTEDIFTGVVEYYPKNMLTKYLLNLREYRPKVVQNFFKDLETGCKDLEQEISEFGGIDAMTYLLASVDEVFHFRNGHWQFVQRYIMANTKYAKATGGTPITTWIPNQLEATLKREDELINAIELLDEPFGWPETEEIYKRIKEDHPKKVQILHNQIEELQKRNYDAGLVYKMNDKFAES